MIYCKDLDTNFQDVNSMLKALKMHETQLIALKRAAIYKSIDKGQYSPYNSRVNIDSVKSDLEMKDGYIYPVINTTLYMDSHSDVHFNGIWNKSIKDNQGTIHYLMDHSLTLDKVVAYPEDVRVFVKELPWAAVGKDYEGTTQALIYEINKKAIVNSVALKAIEDGRKLQNSVRMQYVRVKLAANSTEKDFVENKKYFDSKIDSIANKSEVLQQGYFWGIEEAKILKEGSMVLFGSNDATPILENNNKPEKSTLNNMESHDGTHIKFNINLFI